MSAAAGVADKDSSTSNEASVEAVLAVLRAEGDRVTVPRRLLIGCLIEANGHRTADELATAVRAIAPEVHLSTIYRNLEELERLGVVTHTHLGHGPATYHLASAIHGHLICENCGTMLDAPDEVFDGLRQVALDRFGFAVDPYHFAIFGRCSNCR